MNSSKGFTIIEVLVVLVILGVLSSIAIPMYSDYVLKAKLPEATSALGTMRVKAEQYFADNRSYVGAEANCVAWAGDAQYFDFACGTPAAATYTFTATGKVATPLEGFSYTINQANVRTSAIAAPAPAAWQGTSATCWITAKGGTC